MERIPLSEVTAVYHCPVCKWKEMAESFVLRAEEDRCTRCGALGMEVEVDKALIDRMGLAWCPACVTWH